jgi:hypothetical protein
MNYINFSDKKTLKPRSRHETKDVNKVRLDPSTQSCEILASKIAYNRIQPINDNHLDTMSLLGYSNLSSIQASSSGIYAPSSSIQKTNPSIRELSFRAPSSSICAPSANIQRTNSRNRELSYRAPISNSNAPSSKVQRTRSRIRELNFRAPSSSNHSPISNIHAQNPSIRELNLNIRVPISTIRKPNHNQRKPGSIIREFDDLNDGVNKTENDLPKVNFFKKSQQSLRKNDSEKILKTNRFPKTLGAGLTQEARDEITKNIEKNLNLENFISRFKSNNYVIEIELDRK